jgi:hypothetical protein
VRNLCDTPIFNLKPKSIETQIGFLGDGQFVGAIENRISNPISIQDQSIDYDNQMQNFYSYSSVNSN